MRFAADHGKQKILMQASPAGLLYNMHNDF